MLWLLASALVLVWIVALAMKVTVGAIHLLLLAAVALVIWNVVRGRSHGAV
ncbi:MAG: DUF5670 family protein [Anaeromyxobacter sp.]